MFSGLFNLVQPCEFTDEADRMNRILRIKFCPSLLILSRYNGGLTVGRGFSRLFNSCQPLSTLANDLPCSKLPRHLPVASSSFSTVFSVPSVLFRAMQPYSVMFPDNLPLFRFVSPFRMVMMAFRGP